MNIKEVVDVLNSTKIYEVQLTKRFGLITSTWLLFKINSWYYYFDINQKIEFSNRYKYSEEELVNEFQNSYFEIDMSIS